MLRPRIIPCLLVKNKGLVKTVRFSEPRYVGDPLNTVRLFNEKEVDELMILGIDATVEEADLDWTMVEQVAAECRMPLCYGGGLKTAEQALRLVSLGVEKVALSSAALARPELVSEIASLMGSQSVVVVLDARKERWTGRYQVWTHNATRCAMSSLVDAARLMEKAGAGEIVVNSIDNDGVMQGYDMDLIQRVRGAVRLPITALGGAGSLEDIAALVRRFGLVGAGAGSLFVFKGAYRAVLVNYPGRADKDAILSATPRTGTS